MLESIPEELKRAESLIEIARFDEALKRIEDFEKKESLTPKDKISTLLLRGTIYGANQEFKKAVKVGRRAYKLAQKHEMVIESIRSLLFKADIVFLGEAEKALELLLECEQEINSLTDKSSITILRLKASLFLLKSWCFLFKGEFDSALESAKINLSLREKTGTKLDIAFSNLLLGNINWNLGELDTSLIYSIKSFDLMEELGFHRGISLSSNLVGQGYLDKGELNKASRFFKKGLSFKEIDNRTKANCLQRLGVIHYQKGEIDRSIKYFNQAKELAEEQNLYDQLTLSLNSLGNMYRAKGEYDQAIEFFESSLHISERVGWDISSPLIMLILIYLAKGSREPAQKYFTRLEKYSDQVQTKFVKRFYQVTKAMMLKTSGRTRNRAEAEELLRNIIEDAEDVEFQHLKVITSDLKMFSFINLFDLYFGDLILSNNLEILEDINPLVEKMLNFAKEQHSHFYLAEIKLLQAKIALIQLESTKAEKLLVEAQRIAEVQGIDLLAAKISGEHDTLLTQLDVWKDFEKKNAPISERVKLASIDSVVDRLQRTRAVDPPILVDEQSTLLLIIAEGGILIFSYPFTDEWKRDDELFSSFLSAFTSFSNEFFSEGLDRVKFGKYTVLMESADSFTICYLYRGQTYPAKQKLTKFIKGIQNATSIWQLLEKFYQTGQVLELKDSPPLKTIITEIFISKNPDAL